MTEASGNRYNMQSNYETILIHIECCVSKGVCYWHSTCSLPQTSLSLGENMQLWYFQGSKGKPKI